MRNISICFESLGSLHFLIQALNIGKTGDDFKFSVTDPEAGNSGIFTEHDNAIGVDAIFRPVPEVSYHPDGSLLQKLPKTKRGDLAVHRNPHGTGQRRTPLNTISKWEPFLVYTVYNYALCSRVEISNPVTVPSNDYVFDGTAFRAKFFLGDKEQPTPKSDNRFCVYRCLELSDNLDMLVVFQKHAEQGHHVFIEQLNQWLWSTNNELEIVQMTVDKLY